MKRNESAKRTGNMSQGESRAGAGTLSKRAKHSFTGKAKGSISCTEPGARGRVPITQGCLSHIKTFLNLILKATGIHTWRTFKNGFLSGPEFVISSV